ncbi:hypothetical protein [Lignipirellula cremea]|uniref:Uncharacterized protein n=1 Tax=Lignipirellula cremea TaxID=2528010 RepID=A0A518DZY4_9BACT|nr:hypothetical protein [Lignipirellula cremea]QDU97397.1 hypothetical protein Pla8534_52430 [Lignipirellula cremea]
MAITHVNRQGQTYYLHVGVTRTGKPQFYFSKSPEGTLADHLPEEFEIHTLPSGQVTVRRARPRIITDEELQVVERELAQAATGLRGYVERDGKILTVYAADVGGDMRELLQRFTPFATRESLEDIVSYSSRYEPVFRFVLSDAKKRRYQAQRYCFRGSIDDWIAIGVAGSLEDLARFFLRHIGKDSYYDLI